MRILKIFAATVLVVAPALLAAVPAEAITAGQYAHQGRGHYRSSTGGHLSRPMFRHHRYHHARSRRHRG